MIVFVFTNPYMVFANLEEGPWSGKQLHGSWLNWGQNKFQYPVYRTVHVTEGADCALEG